MKTRRVTATVEREGLRKGDVIVATGAGESRAPTPRPLEVTEILGRTATGTFQIQVDDPADKPHSLSANRWLHNGAVLEVRRDVLDAELTERQQEFLMALAEYPRGAWPKSMALGDKIRSVASEDVFQVGRQLARKGLAIERGVPYGPKRWGMTHQGARIIADLPFVKALVNGTSSGSLEK